MQHPNFIDRFFTRIDPRYLYKHQFCTVACQVHVGTLRKSIENNKPYWKIMDYVPLEPNTILKYLGLAKSLKITGDLAPDYSIFEIIQPVYKEHHPTKLAPPGETVCVTPLDRKSIYPKFK